MDKSEYEEKRKELREKVDSLWEKIRGLDDEYEDNMFQDQKNNIERYYINSFRQKFADTFLFVTDNIEQGYNGNAYVDAFRVRIGNDGNKSGIFTCIDTYKTALDLHELRRTDPVSEDVIIKRVESARSNATKELKDKFDIEL